jgi:serine protease Do
MTTKRVLYVLFVILVAGCSALIGAVAGGVAVFTAMPRTNTIQTAEPVAQLVSAPTAVPIAGPLQVVSSEISTGITRAVETVGSAVVTVVCTQPGQLTPFGISEDQSVTGSGVIISADGYILTNNHVIEDASEVTIILANGEEQPGSIIGADPYSDLAVLKTSGNIPGVAPLGNSDNLKPGETVIAIGSPLGDFKNTVTVGVVSATGRTLDTGKNYQMEEMIQTDAAINQGNSGGPLVNLAGEVIGINTIIVRGSGYSSSAIAEGLGFAIPSNTAAMVANQIIQNGRVARPYIGINWQWVTPRLASYYDLPVKWGAYVSEIDRNGPAGLAGIQRGDIITQIGEITLDGDHPYINALFNYSPGQTIPITVARGNQIITLQVTLDEQTY